MVDALIDCGQVAARHGEDRLRLIDTRWVLGQYGGGRILYEAGHLPGALFMDLDDDLAAAQGPGRHPLPSAEDFAALLGRRGVGPQDHVVAYDQGQGVIAARLWWMLRSIGHRRVSVLNGGFERWVSRGHPVTDEVPALAPTSYRPGRGTTRTVDRDELAGLLGSVTLLDARSPERYRGEVEPIDSAAGHIPTAISAFTDGNLRPDGTFKSVDELKEHFESLGVDPTRPVVTYCGSGVTACHNLLALHVAGHLEGSLYPGSWSDWSSSGMPVAGGPDPG